MKKSIFIAAGISLAPLVCHSHDGQKIVDELNQKMNYIVDVCDNGEPMWKCSGVILRVNENNSLGFSWEPHLNTDAQKNEKFLPTSFVRNDLSNVDESIWFVGGGYGTIYDNNVFPLCAYPSNAFSGDREDGSRGCGFINGQTKESRNISTCSSVGVFLSEEWIDVYKNSLDNSCSFSQNNFEFNEMFRAHKTMRETQTNKHDDVSIGTPWNEVIIDSIGMNFDDILSLPIKSLFYQFKTKVFSLEGSRREQRAIYAKTGVCIPIIQFFGDDSGVNVDDPFRFYIEDQILECKNVVGKGDAVSTKVLLN